MKPKLTDIFIQSFPGDKKALRLDFDNNRFHVSRVITGDRDEVARALYELVLQLRSDGHLDEQNARPETLQNDQH